jgi:predicted nucleic acid-binding protein
MVIKVVDASALAALVFREEYAEQVGQRLADAILVAPALLQFEMSNVCRTKLRQYPALREMLLEQFSMHTSMAIEIRVIDHLAVLGLAERFELSAYDASYLWLAHELGVELVTLDRRLARAADLLGQA